MFRPGNCATCAGGFLCADKEEPDQQTGLARASKRLARNTKPYGVAPLNDLLLDDHAAAPARKPLQISRFTVF